MKNTINLASFFIILFSSLISFQAFAAPATLRVTPLPRTITLLFDDGPHPSITPKVLAILKRYGIKANFALMGHRAERYPSLVKQIVRQGNVLVMHSYIDFQNALPKTIRRELREIQKILRRASGKTPYCIQPPYLRKSHKLSVIANSLGMVVLPKAYDSYDSRNISVSNIVKRTLSLAHSGAIIYLHDTNTRVLLALPQIIKKIRAKGLGFSTICVPQR